MSMSLTKVPPKKKSKPVSFLKLCLNLVLGMVGIHVRTEHKIYERYQIYISVTLYIIHSVFLFSYLVLAEKSFINIVNSILYFSTTSSIFVMFCSIHLRRKYFILCYENIIIRNEYIDDYFHKLVEKQLDNHFPFCLACIAILFTGLGLFPVLVATFTAAELGSAVTLVLPENGPWDQSTPFGYIALLMFQMGSVPLAIAVDVSFICFIGIHGTVIEALFEIIGEKIKDLNENDRNDEQKLLNVFLHLRHLKLIISDFSQAIKLLVDISIVHFYSFSILLLSSVLSLKGIEILDSFKLITMLFIGMAFFAAECYVGEYINHLNDDIMFQLYSINWFEHSITFRKRLNTIMLLLQMPFEIRFMNMQDVNLSLLMKSVQKIYAAIQLLLRVQK